MYVFTPQFAGYAAQLAKGAVITVELFAASFALSFVVGTLIGIVTLSRNVVIQGVWRVYASVVMGVPSLLVIFIIYYGCGPVVAALTGVNGVELSPFTAGLLSLTLVYAAYVAELVHGAVQNLPRGQFEAAAALAIHPVKTWIHVILPQVFRLALPGLVNIWMIVLKDTPLVSLAGLNDLVALSKLAAGASKEPFIFFILAALFFIAVSAATMHLSVRLEARLRRGLALVKT